nr:hypothetical protein [Tanacetum cinerariifolium]
FKYKVLDQEGRGSEQGVHVRHSETVEDKENLSQSGELCWWMRKRGRLQTSKATMSSPNHPTFKIEDAFSSNFPDYVSASSNYFPASPGNTSLDSSNNFTKYLLITLVFSPLHDDPYMEVMQAYDATNNELPIPPLQAPITQPTAVSPSPVLSLSPMLDSRDLLPLEEISPKETKTSKSSIPISPSSSVESSSSV